MSKLLGKPPIMVAGMTPTTVNPQIVSAIMNAGIVLLFPSPVSGRCCRLYSLSLFLMGGSPSCYPV